jgi:hypothetical protein
LVALLLSAGGGKVRSPVVSLVFDEEPELLQASTPIIRPTAKKNNFMRLIPGDLMISFVLILIFQIEKTDEDKYNYTKS